MLRLPGTMTVTHIDYSPVLFLHLTSCRVAAAPLLQYPGLSARASSAAFPVSSSRESCSLQPSSSVVRIDDALVQPPAWYRTAHPAAWRE
ncbi:hypothetical protein RJZ56_007101 [Blastomyces dermatitidis]